MKSFCTTAASFFLCFATIGCRLNPNVEIVGSYFPGWLLSLCVAVGLTGVAHGVLRRYKILHTVGHPALIYPCMVVLFTCLLWLFFFA